MKKTKDPIRLFPKLGLVNTKNITRIFKKNELVFSVSFNGIDSIDIKHSDPDTLQQEFEEFVLIWKSGLK